MMQMINTIRFQIYLLLAVLFSVDLKHSKCQKPNAFLSPVLLARSDIPFFCRSPKAMFSVQIRLAYDLSLIRIGLGSRYFSLKRFCEQSIKYSLSLVFV